MTCHLFLDNFLKISWPLGDFQRFKSFETAFCFKKTQISRIWYHEMCVLSESCLSQKMFYCRKLIVFSCLQFADCYIWSRILCLVVWFCVLITLTESFSLKSFLRNDIIMVLSKTCVRFRNRIFKRFEWVYDQIIFFPVTFGWKDLSSPLWTKFWKLFRFGRWLSLFVLES